MLFIKLPRLKLDVTNGWMLEKRKGYIDQLLRDLKLLEERISTVRDSDSLPFSFFRESFDRIQEIYRTLHLLEFLQIDDMRGQMERLVHFLSEVENKDAREEPEKEAVVSAIAPVDDERVTLAEAGEPDEPIEATDLVTGERGMVQEEVVVPRPGTRGIEFPEYRNPRAHEHALVSKAPASERPSTANEEIPIPSSTRPEQKNVAAVPLPIEKKRTFNEPAFVEGKRASLNDVIPSQPAVVDLRRRISLNDRFLFQRELFGNSRQEMDHAMEQLGKLRTYAEAETYLRESLSLDPENATVSDFLHAIKQGFE